MCSGLGVGFFSIDELSLELKLKNGTEEEKYQVNIEKSLIAFQLEMIILGVSDIANFI